MNIHVSRTARLGAAGLMVCSLLAVGCRQEVQSLQRPAATSVGKPLPELRAEGWINGGPVTNADLVDKVVVIDCFAWW